MSSVEETVKSKIFEYFEIIHTFQKDLSESNIQNSKDAAEVSAVVSKNKDAKPSDVEKNLVAIQVRSWEMYIKDLDMSKNIRPLIELMNIADIHKIELNLSQDELEFYEKIKQGYGFLYIAKNGKLIVTAEEQFAELKNQASENAKNTENLEAVFAQLNNK